MLWQELKFTNGFKKGLIEDKSRFGCPSTARINKNVEKIQELMLLFYEDCIAVFDKKDLICCRQTTVSSTTTMRLHTQLPLSASFWLQMSWFCCPMHPISSDLAP